MSHPPISEYINSDFGRIQVLDNFRISLSGCIMAQERFPSVTPQFVGFVGEFVGFVEKIVAGNLRCRPVRSCLPQPPRSSPFAENSRSWLQRPRIGGVLEQPLGL